MLFGLSYMILGGMVALEGAMLREALREIVMFKRLYSGGDRQTENVGLPTGTHAPSFSARLLDTSHMLSTVDLEGDPAILLFVSPPEALSPGYRHLTNVIHALWHQVEGHVYFVCNGSEEACRQFALNQHVHEFAENQVPVIIDNEGSITRRFQVDSTPMAVELDENGFVNRYGHPVVRAAPAEGGDEEEEQEEEQEEETTNMERQSPRLKDGLESTAHLGRRTQDRGAYHSGGRL
jgi:hypothetical protein